MTDKKRSVKQVHYSLQSGGILMPKDKKKEADSSSAFSANLRAQKSKNKEKAPAQVGNLTTRTHLKESSQDAAQRFRVVIIQEGLGNLRDCFFYTKKSLQDAVALFEGKKCFADHPSSFEEEARPERSTRDIIGQFENVSYEEVDGRGRIVSNLVLVNDPSHSWAQALLKHSLSFAQKFPTQDFVGLSINASGEANEVPIEKFLKETDLPASVLPKLKSAQDEGISSIRVVSALKDAVSCDLVTEAGAGGKILQMIEQEKKPMKKNLKENEKKETKEKDEEEKKEADSQDKEGMESGNEADPSHADEEQDKKLFSQMVKQYLGDDHEEDQEAHEMAKHAYEACQADGMSHEMSYETAGKHLAMAKKVGKKMKQVSSEKETEAEQTESEADETQECEAEEKESKESKTQESSVSLRKELLREKAQNAKLKESLKKYELKEYLDKKLSESKKPVSVTKKFREALGNPKSKEHIDSAYKMFIAAYESASEEADDFSSFVLTEKSSFTESDTGAEGSFEDCVS